LKLKFLKLQFGFDCWLEKEIKSRTGKQKKNNGQKEKTEEKHESER